MSLVMRKLSLALTLILFLVSGPSAGFGWSQVYSGEGRAVLGSSMTPKDTKDLAFEKARQSALEKFGAFVRSEQKLVQVETPEGVREMSENRIAVLAAGNASLVKDSKEVHRVPTEETIIYKVTAEFRIEPTNFGETLRAYQNVNEDSRLKRTVDTALELQEEIIEIDVSVAEHSEVRRLLSQTKGSYDAISGAVRAIDGSGIRSDITKQRRQRKNALLRYIQDVREYGYPGDLVELQLSEPEIEDQGDMIQFTYESNYELSSQAQEVISSCRQTRPIWWPDEEGKVSRGRDGWINQFFDAESEFYLEQPLALYLLDENKNVILIVGKGGSFEREIELDYKSCSDGRFLTTDRWSDKWEFEVPTEYVSDIEGVVFMISYVDYEEIAQRSGFEQVQSNMGIRVWGRSSDRPVSMDRFVYSRQDFKDFAASQAEKAKALPPGGS